MTRNLQNFRLNFIFFVLDYFREEVDVCVAKPFPLHLKTFRWAVTQVSFIHVIGTSQMCVERMKLKKDLLPQCPKVNATRKWLLFQATILHCKAILGRRQASVTLWYDGTVRGQPLLSGSTLDFLGMIYKYSLTVQNLSIHHSFHFIQLQWIYWSDIYWYLHRILFEMILKYWKYVHLQV